MLFLKSFFFQKRETNLLYSLASSMSSSVLLTTTTSFKSHVPVAFHRISVSLVLFPSRTIQQAWFLIAPKECRGDTEPFTSLKWCYTPLALADLREAGRVFMLGSTSMASGGQCCLDLCTGSAVSVQRAGHLMRKSHINQCRSN